MIVSSDVPPLICFYTNLAEELLHIPFFSVTTKMKTGLVNRYDDPEAVGADRIVNAVAVGKWGGTTGSRRSS